VSWPARECAVRGCRVPAEWSVEVQGPKRCRERWMCEEHATAALLDECADVACHDEDGNRYVVGADGQLVEDAA
jgi:hypothetical protein